MPDLFLTDDQLNQLTGIYRGRNNKRREELQAEHLRKIGVPFYPNARGKPIVAREALLGNKKTKSKPAWEPKPLRGS